MIRQLFRPFRIARDERLAALCAMMMALLLNGLVISRYLSVFIHYQKGAWGPFMSRFHVSGFDAISYTIISQWSVFHHICVRHPLLTVFFTPLHWLNRLLYFITGQNCVQFLYALLLVVCAVYSYLFLTRIFRFVVGVSRRESWLLGAYSFSMAYMMLSICVPDHFGLSLFVLTFILWMAGRGPAPSPERWGAWRVFWLTFLTAGLTLTNGIKAILAALYVRGKHFWQPRVIIIGCILPIVLNLTVSHYQYQWIGRPAEIARAKHKARNDSLQARLHPERIKKKPTARANPSKKGKAISEDGMLRWSDITTPRIPAAVHNLFGESLQLHADSLLQDIGMKRPVIVKYRSPLPYVVEAVIVLLMLFGVWKGRRQRFLWLLLGWFAYDMVIHFGFGFALNEVYIMTAHWAFIIPIATAYLLKSLRRRTRRAAQLLIMLLTVYLWVSNLWLLAHYLLT